MDKAMLDLGRIDYRIDRFEFIFAFVEGLHNFCKMDPFR